MDNYSKYMYKFSTYRNVNKIVKTKCQIILEKFMFYDKIYTTRVRREEKLEIVSDYE